MTQIRPNSPRSNRPRRGPARLREAAGTVRAFTIIEIIVAVAAVALVAVGLASIFDAVGKTVNGGKRLSLLNQYAGLIENQMRKDFNEMTRDGFLSIRQQFIDNNAGGTPDGQFIQFGNGADLVALSPTDERPRPRRADEIVFFAQGKFQTSRQPVHPDAVVKSDAAYIYYGHGQRRRDDSEFDPPGSAPANADIYAQPQTDDLNVDDFNSREARLGIGAAAKNPNLFAGDWTLQRKVALLVKPQTTQSNPIPGPLVFANPASGALEPALDPNGNPTQKLRLANREWQIALQPAARSVFRSFNRYFPRLADGGDADGLPLGAEGFRPVKHANLASGLVDIASTDLSEIRSIVQGMVLVPKQFDPLNTSSIIDAQAGIGPAGWDVGFPAPFPTAANLPRTTPAASLTPLERMQLWMSDAFPTESSMGPRFTSDGNPNGTFSKLDPWGVRPRYESEPVDLLQVVAGYVKTPAIAPVTPGQQVAYERADQLMLVSSNFLPRCSEFAIDWSFGQTDPVTQEVIWHGPAVRYDSNSDGVINASDAYSTLPYPFNANAPTANPDFLRPTLQNSAACYRVSVPRMPYGPPETVNSQGNTVGTSRAKPYPYFDTLPRNMLYYDHAVSDRLIYGYRAWAPGDPVEPVLTSYFGYADPTYKQDLYLKAGVTDGRATPGRQIDLDGNGYIGTDANGQITNLNELIPGEPGAASIPWAWPRMIRVTVTLSDALDPTIESTFQFIFNVASDPAPTP